MKHLKPTQHQIHIQCVHLHPAARKARGPFAALLMCIGRLLFWIKDDLMLILSTHFVLRVFELVHIFYLIRMLPDLLNDGIVKNIIIGGERELAGKYLEKFLN